MSNIWGNGCKLCANTGEEWLNVSSGDGWAGRPCPHCVPGGELYDDRDPPDDVAVDFFAADGSQVDSCESWQIDTVLPRLQVLYGDVTMIERGAVADVAGDDFGTWLMSV